MIIPSSICIDVNIFVNVSNNNQPNEKKLLFSSFFGETYKSYYILKGKEAEPMNQPRTTNHTDSEHLPTQNEAKRVQSEAGPSKKFKEVEMSRRLAELEFENARLAATIAQKDEKIAEHADETLC